MSDTVIRRDIVQIGWEVEPSPLDKITKETEKYQKAFKKFAGNEEKLKAFSKEMRTLNNQRLTKLSKSIDDVTKKIGFGLVTASKKAVKAIATVGAAAGGAAFAGAVEGVNYNAQMETYQTSFEVMTGSAQKAQQTVSKLQKLGASTPFEMTDLADTTQLLMNYGFTADTAINRLTMLGDIAQGDADKMNRIAMAYGQMSSAGKVSLEDVKQMIEAGFNPLQEISTTTGESMSSLYDRISKGKLSVDELTASMQRSTSEGGKYFQSMEKQSKTFSGQVSTMKDNFNQLLGSLTKGLSDKLATTVLPKINAFMGELSEAFSKGGFSGLFNTLTAKLGPFGTAMQNIVNKVKAFVSNKEKMQLVKDIFEKIKTTANNLAIFIGKVATAVWDFATSTGVLNGVKTIFDSISKVVGWCKDNFEKIKEVVVAVGGAFLIVGAGVKIVTAAFAVYNAIQKAYKTIQLISTAAQMGFNAAMLACPITWIVVALVALIAVIILLVRNWDKVKAAAVKCWDKIKEIWSKVSTWFSENVIQPVSKFFSDLWSGITDAVSGVKDAITGAFQKAWDSVTKLWSGITDFFKGIWDGIKGIVSKIIGKGKEAKGASDDAKAKEHARGGLVTRPHLGIVGEAGAEMIIPLTKKQRGLALWEKAGRMLGAFSAPQVSVAAPKVSLPKYSPSSSVSTTTSNSTQNNSYAPSFTLNMHGTVDKTTERTVKKWVKEAMEDVFESMERTSPRLTEV